MDDFFTVSSLSTFGGAVTVVVVILNTVRHAFNWGPRWFGLIISVLVSLGALLIATSVPAEAAAGESGGSGIASWIVAVVNGCLIYTSAFGLQNTVVTPRSGGSGSGVSLQSVASYPSAGGKLGFRSPW